jgi:hypothetical protein
LELEFKSEASVGNFLVDSFLLVGDLELDPLSPTYDAAVHSLEHGMAGIVF